MQKNALLIFLSLITIPVHGQDYKTQFDQLFSSGDTTKQIPNLLLKWEAEDSNNPELLASYFNFYFQQAAEEVISLSDAEPQSQGLVLRDSTGEVSAFLGSTILYDSGLINQAFEKIDRGIKLYPNRLDMRFGKCYVLMELEKWEALAMEIIKSIQYAHEINNEWKWTYNEAVENAQSMFLESIQDYQVGIFEAQDDSLLKYMKEIGEEVIKYYPDHVVSLSNISIYHLVTGQFDEAIIILQKAESINPEDGIILSNIAHAYKLQGDTASAINYYEKMTQLDEPRAIQFAKQQIEALKK